MTPCPAPVQQSDEYFCSVCSLRWAVCEEKPTCLMRMGFTRGEKFPVGGIVNNGPATQPPIPFLPGEHVISKEEAERLRGKYREAYPVIAATSVEMISEGDAAHEALRAVSKGYHDLIALQQKQRLIQAQMLRICISQLQRNDPAKRREAIAALATLATMLEEQK